MIKFIMPLHRKAGMSPDEFRSYYETFHRVIGEKYLNGFVSKYIRRYPEPLPDRQGKIAEPDFDVLLEIWYPDASAQAACAKHLSTPAIAAEIAEDEKQLFDRSRMRGYIVTEHESQFGETSA